MSGIKNDLKRRPVQKLVNYYDSIGIASAAVYEHNIPVVRKNI